MHQTFLDIRRYPDSLYEEGLPIGKIHILKKMPYIPADHILKIVNQSFQN
jgi:hypothetical protein